MILLALCHNKTKKRLWRLYLGLIPLDLLEWGPEMETKGARQSITCCDPALEYLPGSWAGGLVSNGYLCCKVAGTAGGRDKLEKVGNWRFFSEGYIGILALLSFSFPSPVALMGAGLLCHGYLPRCSASLK